MRRIRNTRTMILSAVCLLLAIGALKLCSVQLQPRGDSGRQSALLQATELLLAPPASVRTPQPHWITRANYQFAKGSANRAPDDRVPGTPGGDTYADGSAGARSGKDAPGTRRLPQIDGRGNLAATPGSESHAPADAEVVSPKAPIAAPAVALHKKLRSPIPASIEDGLPAHSSGDALYGMTVHGELRVADGTACPFRLSATRTDSGNARAQLQDLRTNGAAGTSSGWLEVGDSPGQGWRIFKINPEEVLLMDTQGNPVRLKSIPVREASIPANSPH